MKLYLRLLSAGLAFVLSQAGQGATPSLPVDAAERGARAALETCRARGYSVSVVVLALDLGPLAVLRANAAHPTTIEIARHKAYTVIKTGLSSLAFGLTLPPERRVMPPPGYHGPMPPPGPIASDPMLDPSGGGLPILVRGRLVGALSASGAPGGEKDEACAWAGVETIARELAGAVAG